MRYLRIETGPWSRDEPLPWWARLPKKVIPDGNPDIGHLYQDTHYWWLEIDDAGAPLREIGFDENGAPVVLAPVEGNYGMLIDASDDWSDSVLDAPELAKEFENVWRELWPKFADVDRCNGGSGLSQRLAGKASKSQRRPLA